MIGPIYRVSEIRADETIAAWRRDIFESFESDMLSEATPFPCIFGVNGLKHDELRIAFVDSHCEDAAPLLRLAESLQRYLRTARELGRNTSLVAFFQPERSIQEASYYERRFWEVLDFLHRHDPEPWPPDIPRDPGEHMWEFCYAGEPIFVVCNTPAHRERRSRSSRTFMITFQPRWVFDDLHPDTKAGQNARKAVRERLQRYDREPIYPHLGSYGDPENLEWKQYFIPDKNSVRIGECPFSSVIRQARER